MWFIFLRKYWLEERWKYRIVKWHKICWQASEIQYCTLKILLFCAGDPPSRNCNPTICNQCPKYIWLAIRSIRRTVRISSAVRLPWVGNHCPFSRLFAWQPKPSCLGLGMQNWAIDGHPHNSGTIRHNMEPYCHKLQFMGDLWASSWNNFCSCCSFCCCCSCGHPYILCKGLKKSWCLRLESLQFELFTSTTIQTILEEWSIFIGMTEIITKSWGCSDEQWLSFTSLSRPRTSSAWCMVTKS